MSEWNDVIKKSLQSALDLLENCRLKLGRFTPGEGLLLIALLLVGGVLFTAWFTVQPEETGIVQRFGKVMRTAGPGLHFKLPGWHRNGPAAAHSPCLKRGVRFQNNVLFAGREDPL